MVEQKGETNMTVKIDSNVPFPSVQKRKTAKWPFPDMNVGDSFEFASENRASISASCTYYSKRLGRKYATRNVDGVYRCWRIA